MIYQVKYINEIGDGNTVESIVRFTVSSYTEFIAKEKEFKQQNPWFNCPATYPELIQRGGVASEDSN